MGLLRTIVSSVYNPAFYNELRTRSIWKSIRYFIFLCALVAIVYTISLAPAIVGAISRKTVDGIAAAYPADLQVTIVNGQASINQPEPYFIKNNIPGETASDTQNLLVIDTKDSFTTDEFSKFSTEAVLTKDFLAVNSKDQVRLMPLDKIKNFTLNKSFVDSVAAKTYPYLTPIAVFVLIVVAIFLTIGHLFTLVYLFIPAFLIWLYGKLMNKTLPYGTSYKVALHAATLPILLSAVLDFTRIHEPFFSFTLLLLLIAVLNLYQGEKAAAQVSQ